MNANEGPNWNPCKGKFVSERLKSISFDPPTRIRASGISGWVQTHPADEALCVACGGTLDQMFVTAVYGAEALIECRR